ncbi:hypothetical protein NDU88_008181 [Pleurodeles waltl]|uniref:Uncharacterized protein n=1 Tax=Pleurodeles waltl TaxID=8319 RepID=A0AAV7P2W6_PLEWA|nr:hypothetical protein NDU88_008181 [Pleurodeles waltl]
MRSRVLRVHVLAHSIPPAAVQCKDKKIQERLRQAKDPTLMEAIGVAKVTEELQQCMKELNSKDKTTDASLLLFVSEKRRMCYDAS